MADDDFEMFKESDSVAIFEDSPGVIKSLPVFLGDGNEFIRVAGHYLPAATCGGFRRFEKLPNCRPQPIAERLPVYAFEVRAKVIRQENPLERMAATQREWAQEE